MSIVKSYQINTTWPNGVSYLKLQHALNTAANTTDCEVLINSGVLDIRMSVAWAYDAVVTGLVSDEVPFIYALAQRSPTVTAGNFLQPPVNSLIDGMNVDASWLILIFINTVPQSGNLTTINSYYNSYVEPPPVHSVVLTRQNGVIRTDNGVNLTSIQPLEIIISKSGLSQFNSLAAAVQSVSGATGCIFRVYPGTYYETNPITLPANCSVVGEGTAGNCIIVGVVSTSPVFVTTDFNGFDGITIAGGSMGINHASTTPTSLATIKNSQIASPLGMTIGGSMGSMIVHQVALVSPNGFIVNNSSLIITDVFIEPSPPIVTGTVGVQMNGGVLTANTLSIYYCDTALVNNGGVVRGGIINIIGNNLAINNSGTMICSYIVTQQNGMNLTNTGTMVANSNMSDDTVTQWSDFIGELQNNTYGYKLNVGDTLVGSDRVNASLIIGNNCNPNNLVVTDGTTDISASVRTPYIPHVTATIIYIHTDALITGLEVVLTSGSVVGADSYIGTTWTALRTTMVTQALQGGGTNNLVFFDSTYEADTVTVASISAAWIRLTLNNATIQFIRQHKNVSYFNAGTMYAFGTAQRTRTIYLPTDAGTKTILMPDRANMARPWTITVAGTSTTINGTTATTASVYFTPASTLQFTVGGTLTMVAATYYEF